MLRNDDCCLPPASRWHFESYSVSQVALLVQLLARQLKTEEEAGAVWPAVDADDLLFLNCLFAVPLAGHDLLLCECPPTQPNPSRIYQVVEKYKVRQLIITEEYTKLLRRSEDFEPIWAQGGLLHKWGTPFRERRHGGHVLSAGGVHGVEVAHRKRGLLRLA